MTECVKDARSVWGGDEPSMQVLASLLDESERTRFMRTFNILLRRTGHAPSLNALTFENVMANPKLHGAFLVCHAYYLS